MQIPSIYGIQGGKGSFNEEALRAYCKRELIADFEISYLYTTKKVLKSISSGEIDFGIFAIVNSVGGLVEETLEVIGSFTYKVHSQITIPINHFLMKRTDISTNQIQTITAHPQVLTQCKNNLSKKYSGYKLQSGSREYIDTAKAAEALFEGKIDLHTYILGPKVLAEIYGFDIVAENLQDRDDNRTTFLIVKK